MFRVEVFASVSAGKDAFHLAATVTVHQDEGLAGKRKFTQESARDLVKPKNNIPEARGALRDVSPEATRTGAPPCGEAVNDQLQICLVR